MPANNIENSCLQTSTNVLSCKQTQGKPVSHWKLKENSRVTGVSLFENWIEQGATCTHYKAHWGGEDDNNPLRWRVNQKPLGLGRTRHTDNRLYHLLAAYILLRIREMVGMTKHIKAIKDALEMHYDKVELKGAKFVCLIEPLDETHLVTPVPFYNDDERNVTGFELMGYNKETNHNWKVGVIYV